jgi:transposase InsO family protein
LSASQLCEMGYNCLFTNKSVTIFRRSDSSFAFKGVIRGKLYLVFFVPEEVELDKCLIAKRNIGWLWHRRLDDVGMRNLHELQRDGHILGLMNNVFEKDRPCGVCQAGKQVGEPHYAKNIMTTTRPLEMLPMNLFGPIAYISIGGNKYGPVIVDVYSHFTWVFFLHDKSETQEVLKKFLKRAQNEFDAKVNKIRSGNGSELKNIQVEDYLDQEDIKHEFLTPYTPQQNGVAGRKNTTLIESTRTILDEYKTHDCFWAEAINTACHAINRLYLHRLLKKTSYKLLTSNKPNVSYFRVFGSKCYIFLKRYKTSKFAPKIYEGFMLGYDSNSYVYRVFNKDSSCVETMFDVVFDETNDSQVEQCDVDDEEAPCDALRNMTIGDVRPQEANEDQPSSNKAAPPTQDDDQNQEGEQDKDDDQHHNMGNDQGGVEQDEDKDDQGKSRSSPLPYITVRRTIQRDHPINNILGAIEKGVTTQSCVTTFCEHYSFISSFEPFEVEDALRDPGRVVSMQEKLNNFKRNKVWSLVERPKQNIVGTQWVFHNK